MKKGAGIIVGRFQVASLTEGHYSLISSVLQEFSQTVLFIGTTKDGCLTSHDPLPWQARHDMIRDTFPELGGRIFSIRDIGDWKLWVAELDKKIDSLSNLGIIDSDLPVWICGSRDSVPCHYAVYGGKHNTHLIDPFGEFSGTAARKKTANEFVPTWNAETRSLAIWLADRNGKL